MAGIADPSAVFIPAILAGLVGVLGLAVLLGAYGRRHATPIEPSLAGGAARRATTAQAILLVGAIAVTGLGVALGVALSDGSTALIGVGAATGPALAGLMASTARNQIANRANNTRPTTP